jgi:hypothetical protein
VRTAIRYGAALEVNDDEDGVDRHFGEQIVALEGAVSDVRIEQAPWEPTFADILLCN